MTRGRSPSPHLHRGPIRRLGGDPCEPLRSASTPVARGADQPGRGRATSAASKRTSDVSSLGDEVVVDSRAAPAAREPWPPTRRSPRRLPQALTRPRHAAVSKTGPDGMRVRIAAVWW